MALNLDLHTDSSFSSLYDSTRHRPSVRWDLDSPDELEVVAKASGTSSGVPNLGFQRGRLNSGPDLGFGVQPMVLFQRPRTNRLFSITHPNEAAIRKMLPKSQLSRVIIRDNSNAQRICEMEMSTSDKTKKKMSHLYDYLKKKFLTDQLRKMGRWRQESLGIQDYLDSNRLHVLKIRSPMKTQPP